MQIDHPFRVDARGRTALATPADHVRDLIELVLFTSPGERVNRPTFGSGVMQLVFAPSGDELATATQFMIQGALQQWLGDVVQVTGLSVVAEDSTLRVTIEYVVRRTGERRTDAFSREV